MVTDENLIKKELSNREIELFIRLKKGNQSFWILTCDLTEEYIRINSAYRS
ncbi:MAG: bifunctional ornithine acetyltransferase/N-acetylglutamate synthase [Caldimicrobium sp.]